MLTIETQLQKKKDKDDKLSIDVISEHNLSTSMANRRHGASNACFDLYKSLSINAKVGCSSWLSNVDGNQVINNDNKINKNGREKKTVTNDSPNESNILPPKVHCVDHRCLLNNNNVDN